MSSLIDLIESGIISEGVPLGPMTTYKSGGPARYLAEVADRPQLLEVIASGITADLPTLIVGRGSNLVVSDAGFDGVVLRLGPGFSELEIRDSHVVAGASVPLPRVARASVEAGLRGLEFFVGVPGSVGGAIRQNAGCFGTETKDRLVDAEIVSLIDGGVKRLGPEGLELSYRHSNVGPRDLVTEATFRAEPGDETLGRAEIRRVTRWRRENQPGGTLNAGSVFKNPAGISAGELIDSLGLKGLSVGDVEVSERHANFFVAGPDATSTDIYRLVNLVKDRVFELSGTKLEPEIEFVGFEHDD
jgi:UDP-N-acetylmuramate dehydrogenase